MDLGRMLECEDERATSVLIVGVVLILIFREDEHIPERPSIFTWLTFFSACSSPRIAEVLVRRTQAQIIASGLRTIKDHRRGAGVIIGRGGQCARGRRRA